MTDFFNKPVDPAALFNAIYAFMDHYPNYDGWFREINSLAPPVALSGANVEADDAALSGFFEGIFATYNLGADWSGEQNIVAFDRAVMAGLNGIAGLGITATQIALGDDTTGNCILALVIKFENVDQRTEWLANINAQV